MNRTSGDTKSKERRWAPRIWLGCDFFAWIRLLVRNRLAVGWGYLYIVLVDTFSSLINTLLRCVQTVFYGRRVARTEIRQPPIFIIGHWRSGTTLLHEFLALDTRLTYPTTYECFAPGHFLLTERLFTRCFAFLMPRRRPMDNMAAGWQRPQEDEFAMCNLGQPSPYLTIAFPNRAVQFPEYLDLEGISPRALRRWKRAYLRFLKQITLKRARRIVLKSPVHTCRIKVLQELFPEACFVNIVRDPYTLFASTVRLWKSLYTAHGLQRPRFEGLEEYVLATFSHLHEKLEETRGLVDPTRFYELRYEDLVADPIGKMRALYEHLGLGGFEDVLPALKEYLAEQADYKTNRHELSPEQRAEVAGRWAPYFEKYGYARDWESRSKAG